MADTLPPFQNLSFFAVCIRLVLAAATGAFIGLGRTRKHRAAGIRTHMLTSTGSALTILLAIYDYAMLQGPWTAAVAAVGVRLDVSRYAAGVVSGIGFLAAGTIITVAHQQKEGLTTATGLFASVCVGLASGAGFYSCTIVASLLIVGVLDFMPPEEMEFKRRIRAITIFVEYTALEDISAITMAIENRKAKIHEIDIERAQPGKTKNPCAIFTIKMAKGNASHSGMLSAIAKLPCVHSVQELIA